MQSGSARQYPQQCCGHVFVGQSTSITAMPQCSGTCPPTRLVLCSKWQSTDGATSGCLSHGGMYSDGTGVWPEAKVVLTLLQLGGKQNVLLSLRQLAGPSLP